MAIAKICLHPPKYKLWEIKSKWSVVDRVTLLSLLILTGNLMDMRLEVAYMASLAVALIETQTLQSV